MSDPRDWDPEDCVLFIGIILLLALYGAIFFS
jgi:hypothetical protein